MFLLNCGVLFSLEERQLVERENRVRESFSIGGLLRPTFKTKLTATIFLNELIKTIQKNNWIFSTYFSVFLFSIFFFSFFFFFFCLFFSCVISFIQATRCCLCVVVYGVCVFASKYFMLYIFCVLFFFILY